MENDERSRLLEHRCQPHCDGRELCRNESSLAPGARLKLAFTDNEERLGAGFGVSFQRAQAARNLSDGLLVTTPWRFGLLCSQTGVTAAVEKTQLQASILAIERVNASGGIAGRPIEPVIYDPASDPKQFAACAERLLTRDGIRLLFGCYMSSTRKAVLPLVEASRGLLFYPTLYEGFEYSKHCIYTGAAPNQNSRQLAAYLFENHGRRFFFVGSNYVYPYESNRIMTDLVRQAGGVVLDETYVPLAPQAEDFAKVVQKIGRAKPDVVFSTVVGRGTAMFYEAFAKAGLDSAVTPIASLTTCEAEVAEMSPAAAAGHITAAPFFDILSSPEATAFISAYRLRFGSDAPVPAAAEAAYFQIFLAAQAIERAGTDDPDRVHSALPDCELDAPQGRVRVDRENNHTYLWPRVARLDQNRRFEVVWSAAHRVKPDPYRVTQTLDDWSGGVAVQAYA